MERVSPSTGSAAFPGEEEFEVFLIPPPPAVGISAGGETPGVWVEREGASGGAFSGEGSFFVEEAFFFAAF